MDIKDIKVGERYLVWGERHELHGTVVTITERDNTDTWVGEYCIHPEKLYPLDGSYWLCQGWDKCNNCKNKHKIPHRNVPSCEWYCYKADDYAHTCIPLYRENIPKLFEEKESQPWQEAIDAIHKRLDVLLDVLEGKNQPLDFMECPECAKKPGSPILCPACLNNRQLISDLKKARE